MKIAVVFNQFGPYHYARLNAAGKKQDIYGIELFSKSVDYQWDTTGLTTGLSFKKETLFDREDILSVPRKILKQKVFDTLRDINPDVVAVNGWSEAGAFASLKWCIKNKVPAIVMSESTEFDTARIRLKELVKKKIVGKFSSALVGGKPHADYIHKLGIPRSRIFQKYDVIDNSHFYSLAEEVKRNINFYSQKLNLSKNFFLASSRFIPKKNLYRLVEAYSIYKKETDIDGWDLILLGDGEMRMSLESLINRLGIQNNVFLPGFIQYNELPYYYGSAKAFIHASISEQWGLVVNEAMASGLPILLSSKCGCAIDLLHDGQNGLLFDPLDTGDLANKMILFNSDRINQSDMSKKSLEIISNFTPEHFAENLSKAAFTAISNKKKKLNILDSLILNYLIYQ
jgi:glycosyltransferase involved in cell wall biosynthesis